MKSAIIKKDLCWLHIRTGQFVHLFWPYETWLFLTSFQIFCFFCFIARSFHSNPPNTTQQSSLHNSFLLAFYFVSKLVRLYVCLRRSVREGGVWRGPEPERRGRGRDVSPQVTINTQKRQVEKLWYGMIQSLCRYFRSQCVVNVSWTSWCSYRSGSSLRVPRGVGGLRPPKLQSLSDCSFKLFYIWDQFSTSCDLLLFHNLPVIKQLSWQQCWETWHGVLRAGRLRYVSAWCYWDSVLTRVSWHGEYDKILNNKRSC